MNHKENLLSKLQEVIDHAKDFHDGHWFIFSFTTGYKGGFGTPDLHSAPTLNEIIDGTGDSAYHQILKLPGFGSLDELVDYMLTPSCGCIRIIPKRESHER